MLLSALVDRYRELLASFPSGVTVVTAFDAGDEPRGLTLVAFCGVSLVPPLVLVCVDRASNTLPAIRSAGGFTVNLISRESSALAHRMATKSPDKWEGVAWRRPPAPPAGPVLHEDTAAHVLCRTVQAVEAGDHVVVIGEVLGGGLEAERPPLLFHRREFRELSGL